MSVMYVYVQEEFLSLWLVLFDAPSFGGGQHSASWKVEIRWRVPKSENPWVQDLKSRASGNSAGWAGLVEETLLLLLLLLLAPSGF